MFTLHLSSLTPTSLSFAQFTEDIQKLDWLYGDKPWSGKIYCCYDGLVLLGVRKYVDINHLILLLWNPSTRESVVLPSTEFLPSQDYTCGLGYDSTSGDYMILKIGYQSCSEILVLKSGSWRTTDKRPTGIYSVWLSDMDSLAFVRGAFHWLGLLRNEFVTSYDILNEVFKAIPLPDGMFVVPDMVYVKHSLSVLGEMICICSTHHDQRKYTFNLWIMKDYGVKESWNQFFTIQSTYLYSLVPEYRFSDGEMLLRCKHFDRCGYIFKTTKESSVFWPRSRSECIRNGFVYPESLISPKLLSIYSCTIKTTSFRGVAGLVGPYNFTYALKLLDLSGTYIRMSNWAISSINKLDFVIFQGLPWCCIYLVYFSKNKK